MTRPFFSVGMRSRAGFQGAPVACGTLSDEMLLEVCRVSVVEADARPQWLENLRTVPLLLGRRDEDSHVALAVTLLASLLGEVPRHNPVHLPFGFGGPRCHSYHWIDYTNLDGTGKQILGLVWYATKPDVVASEVQHAISEAIRLGFLDCKRYDGWRPGMASGSGWRSAVMATPYGVTKARLLASSLMAPGVETVREPEPTECAPLPMPVEPKIGAVDDEQPKALSATSPAARDQDQAALRAGCDQYAWARQIDLVNAANHVLGEGTLHKGVLSRACRMKRVETNGQPGRASRVSLASFLRWMEQQFGVAADEQVQVRNAVIGEIFARGK